MAGSADEAVERALGAVLRDHGWDVAARARRLRGSLNDVLGAEADEHRAAVDAVVLAVEEGIVTDLLRLGRGGAEDAVPAMTARLGEWGLAPGPAAWAVRTWASHLPAPTIQPPGTEPQAPASTTLPPHPTAAEVVAAAAPPVAPTVAPTVAPAVAPTSAPRAAPPVGPTELPAPRPATERAGRRRPRGRALAVAGAATLLLAGGVATAVAMSGRDGERPPGPTPTTRASDVAETAPTAAEPGEVLVAREARVPVLTKRLAMAARTGGVRVARLGEVDTVGSGEDARSAPEGGRLIAFRLADWDCGSDACRSWDRLGLTLDVDGTTRELPSTGTTDTFAVAVPADSRQVDLVLEAGGATQTLSLLDGEPGRDNIAVLARSGRVDEVGARFTMTESTSIAFSYDGVARSSVPRDVTVVRAELTWFVGKRHPSSPRDAFLKVDSHYTVPIGSYADTESAFEPREMVFVARDGTRYRARDLDPGPGVNAVFEVPATVKGGTLVLGGASYPVQSSVGPFTRTLTSRSVPLRFG